MGLFVKNKFIAYNAAAGEHEGFETYEAAKEWLIGNDVNDFSECIPEEYTEGECYIAEITHRTKYRATEFKKDFCECEGPEECDDCNPWPYANEFDSVGVVELEKVASGISKQDLKEAVDNFKFVQSSKSLDGYETCICCGASRCYYNDEEKILHSSDCIYTKLSELIND